MSTKVSDATRGQEPERVLLVPDGERYQDYRDAISGESVEVIGPFSRINLLVGANNAGKSRLVRKVFEARTVQLLPGEYDEKLRAIHDKFLEIERAVGRGSTIRAQWNSGGAICKVETIRKLRARAEAKTPQFWLPMLKERINGLGLPTNLADRTEIEEVFQVLLVAVQNRAKPKMDATFRVDRDEGRPIEISSDLWQLFSDVAKFEMITSDSQKKTYIPVHRTAASLFHDKKERESRDIFRTSIVQNYGLPIDTTHDVFTGLDLYERILRERCGAREIRRRFETFETFLGDTFFGGKPLDLVARYDDDPTKKHVNVLVGEGAEREIHHLGDGISSLLVLFYPIFMADPGSWIIIEEPELHLHPGFQRLFLTTLLNNEFLRDKHLRVFLTTHSNHLLGLAISRPGEVSVFNLSPRQDDAIAIRTMQAASLSVLDELGVENGSVFLANCTIWVEGPSDKLLIDTYLNAYFQAHGVSYLADIDYAFFMYGGSLLKWYLFAEEGESAEVRNGQLDRIHAQFVANRVFLLCDMDNDLKKRERQDSLRRLVGPHFEFSTTEPALEIENTISPTLLARAIPTLRDNFAQMDFAWLSSTPERDMCATRLGQLLKDHGAYLPTETSGTLKSDDKLKLARTVNRLRPTWDDLGENARRLTESIATFIRAHNPTRSTATALTPTIEPGTPPT